MISIAAKFKNHPLAVKLVKMFPVLLRLRLQASKLGRRLAWPLRLLPGTSMQFGPPRGIHRTLEAAPGVTAVMLAEKTIVERKPVLSLSKRVREKFQALSQGARQSVGVTRIKDGRFLGGAHYSQLLSCDDSIVLPFSPLRNEHNPQFHNAFCRIKLPPIRNVKKAVVVYTRCAEANYSHWMLDHMTRFWALREAGTDVSGATLVVPGCGLPFQEYSFRRLKEFGFNFAGMEPITPRLHLRAEELIVPSIVNPGLNMDEFAHRPEQLAFVRELHATERSALPARRRRLFISRAKARRAVAAEPELLARIAKLGFEPVCMEDYSVPEQARMFQQAEIVCGFHGAGLTNIIFAEPGLKVIEIFSPDFIVSNFWSLSNDLGHQYFAYCEDERSAGLKAYGHAQVAPLIIDPDAVADFIRECVAG